MFPHKTSLLRPYSTQIRSCRIAGPKVSMSESAFPHWQHQPCTRTMVMTIETAAKYGYHSQLN